MATVNLTGAGTSTAFANAAIPSVGDGKVYMIGKKIDLTDYTMTAADVYQCLPISEDTLVLQVKIEIVTAAVASALTCTVGDGSGADSWDASVNLAATAGTWTTSAVGTDAYAAAAAIGTFYESADSIDITLGTVTTVTSAPVFKIYALCVDYNIA